MKAKDRERAKEIVTRVLFEWKPFAWMNDDPSDGEFEGEIASIVRQLQRIKSPKDASLVLARVLQSSFSSKEITFEFCQDAGEKLYAQLQAARLLGNR